MATIDSRREQMFPKLTPQEIDRIRRFGTVQRYAKGALLFRTGEVSPGMFVLIIRALILRRVILIEVGAGGPVLIGPATSPDVIRLQGFLARNGYPHQLVDPDEDDDAKALVSAMRRSHPTCRSPFPPTGPF
jgi:hypothetical protein